MVVGNWDSTLDIHAKQRHATFISTRTVPLLRPSSPILSSQGASSISSNQSSQIESVMHAEEASKALSTIALIKNGTCIDPSSAALPHVMEEGEVKLVLHQKVSSKCYRCRKKHLGKGANKSWSYVSTCKECHLHVACVKEILLENWEKKHLGDGRRDVEAERKDSLAPIQSTEPKLQIVLEKKGSKFGKFAKLKEIAKIAITFIMAAVVGDPTALVAALIASLIAH